MKTFSPLRSPIANPAAPVRLLRWRTPWFAQPALIWIAANLTSPAGWCIVLMLAIDTRSDHPLYWWSLPPAIATANALATMRLRHAHRRSACRSRLAVANIYFCAAFPLTALLALVSGWATGFSADIAPVIAQQLSLPDNAWSATACAVLAAVLLSFAAHLVTAAALPSLAFVKSGMAQRLAPLRRTAQ